MSTIKSCKTGSEAWAGGIYFSCSIAKVNISCPLGETTLIVTALKINFDLSCILSCIDLIRALDLQRNVISEILPAAVQLNLVC